MNSTGGAKSYAQLLLQSCGQSGRVPRAQRVQARDLSDCADGALLALRVLAEQEILPEACGSQLLWQRANLLGLALPANQQSANGSCRLLATQDGWLAINLAREEDWPLLPAWLEHSGPLADWGALAEVLNQRPTVALLDRARLMGLAVSAPDCHPNAALWFKFTKASTHPRRPRLSAIKPVIADLSSLWAGPLTSHLLRLSGAEVIKIESEHRPDGMRTDARTGVAEFFGLLNEGKQHSRIDFRSDAGLQNLAQLLDSADIVITSSRPRALQQLGIDADDLIRRRDQKLWLSITGYGTDLPFGDYVAFGDDAAIAGGLIAGTQNAPEFYGDAIADPLTGLHAAVALSGLWREGHSGALDVSLASVSRFCREQSNTLSDSIYQP